MFYFFLISLLLVYFWYFYFSFSSPVPFPTTSNPDPLPEYNLIFRKHSNNTFHFYQNGQLVWEHTFPQDSLLVTLDKIVAKDDCHFYEFPTKIPATGFSLYKYLKEHPTFDKLLSFPDDNTYTMQEGTPFYFQCKDRHIEKLDICPPGTHFQKQHCVPVNLCTGQPDYTLLPDVTNNHHYFECKNNRAFLKKCKSSTFFYYDRCVDIHDLTFQCKLQDTVSPIKLDDRTLFECRNHQTIYTTCAPGTQLFEHNYCEPSVCVGLPDQAKVPLEEQSLSPFKFSPGYIECMHGKVFQTIECPKTWDSQQSQGDNLTSLPMVFDGQTCSIPTFCENVTSSDPEIMVPVHEFTKHVQNWKFSEQYDRMAGYTCTTTGRKRKILDPGQRINKHFKVESACDPLALLPIFESPRQYYDCFDRQTKLCPPHQFFNGVACQVEPSLTFQYKGIPFFQFDHLNEDTWMDPWDYAPRNYQPAQCENNFTYLKNYNICAEQECLDYAFVSMIPDFTPLLPRPQQARCKFSEADRHLRKEPVAHEYTFWDQRIRSERGLESCTFGQTLKTGHLIWDSTIYATCDPTEPFIFCPSPHTDKLLRENNVYACAPPPLNIRFHTVTTASHLNPRVNYTTNEVKRIVPPVWDGTPYTVSLSKNGATQYQLPETGLEVPIGTRLNLQTDRPVDLELRYRVTYPIHVAFQYDDDTNQLEILSSDKDKGFLVKTRGFTSYLLNLPTYKPQIHVPKFLGPYHP